VRISIRLDVLVAEGDGVRPLERAITLASRDAAAAEVAEPVVPLSPACTSFNQYRNFEVRGDAFCALVLALPGVAQV